MSSIWDSLVGQDDIVTSLERAVVDAERRTRGEPGPAMTHAWLFTGPPGSGRSTAAACFAAALVCPEGGCGVCQACRTAPLGGHPDVDMVRPEGVSYVVKEARALVMTSELSPAKSFWHVMVVEDADRLTDAAVNALLKSIEEPPPHTVWILCAPSVEDVLPTIVSRARHVALRTPSARDVADLLVERYGVDRAIAAFAARASQGHIGRARALATDEHARLRRQDVLRIPLQLHDIPSCFMNAANLISAATEDAKAITDPIDEFEDEQLVGLYRDVLLIQVDSGVPLINEEMRPQLTQVARQGVANDTGRRLRAISYARAQVQKNVTPLLAMESLMIELKDPWIRSAIA